MSNPYNSQNNGEQDNQQPQSYTSQPQSYTSQPQSYTSQPQSYTSQPQFSNGYATPNQISDEPVSFAPPSQSYGNQSYGNQSYGNQSYGNQSYGNQSNLGYNNYSSPNPEAGKKLSTVALVFSLIPTIFFITVIFLGIAGASALQSASEAGVDNLTGGMLLFFIFVGFFAVIVCPASLVTSLTLSIVGLSKGYQYKGKLTAALVITIISMVLGFLFMGMS